MVGMPLYLFSLGLGGMYYTYTSYPTGTGRPLDVYTSTQYISSVYRKAGIGTRGGPPTEVIRLCSVAATELKSVEFSGGPSILTEVIYII